MLETSTVENTQTTYPTEVLDLPSKGIFYPEGHPLKSGQIELKYMTAKEEDILTSTNLIQKGLVLDKLVDAIIVTKGVKSSDLLLGDLNAVLVATRILGYGANYEATVTCPRCGKQFTQTVNLSSLGVENEPDGTTVPELTTILPVSKAEVTIRPLTRGDELQAEKELQALKKVNSNVDAESTTRLKSIIVSVNGDTSKKTIWAFVDNMLVKDARYLREFYRTHVPDVDFNIEVECDCTPDKKTVRLPMGPDFFWPDAAV